MKTLLNLIFLKLRATVLNPGANGRLSTSEMAGAPLNRQRIGA
jgi:hypothetical protein